MEGKCKATWKREFKISWREAGPPNHHDDKVDSDRWVVNKDFSLSSTWCFVFEVWGAGAGRRIGVSCLGVRVWVSGFGFWVSGFGVWVWVWVSCFGFRVSGFGFRVLGFEFRVSGCGFRVSGFEFRVSGCGLRVSG